MLIYLVSSLIHQSVLIFHDKCIVSINNTSLYMKEKASKNLVPIQSRDETFNLNKVLLQNIKKSPYFLKLCTQITNWSQAVDEIYYKVDHLEAWSVGEFIICLSYWTYIYFKFISYRITHIYVSLGGKVPSSAYCILLRLFLLRVSKKEMNEMLIHPDSPYIIGIGLLYLRYICDPDVLWEYFKIVMDNETEIKSEQRNKKQQTITEYANSLLQSNQAQFPRIPASLEDTIHSKLQIEREKLERKQRHLRRGNERRFVRGSEVIGMYEDEVCWENLNLYRQLLHL